MKIDCQLHSYKIIPFIKIWPDTTFRNTNSGQAEKPLLTSSDSELQSGALGLTFTSPRSGHMGFSRAIICSQTITCPPTAPRMFFYTLLENNSLASKEELFLLRLFVLRPHLPTGLHFLLKTLKKKKNPINTIADTGFHMGTFHTNHAEQFCAMIFTLTN